MSTQHFALIGAKLGHSLSKQLFDSQGFANADYQLVEMESLDGLWRWVANEGICGFNVTNPYKCAILPLLDAVSPEATAIGAVNCVKVCDGRLIGYNTDAPAFRDTLIEKLSTFNFQLSTFNSAFILGTGGAARAVAYALVQLGIPYTFVSRHPEVGREKRKAKVIGYDHFSTFNFQLSTLLVNATPVGMYPDIDTSPLPLPTTHYPLPTLFVYDLIYNPSPTMLMRQAVEKGAKVTDGMAMLRRQAELSWHIFFFDKAEYQQLVK